MGNGVAYLHLLRVLDAADDVAHVARRQFLTGYHVHLQHAHLVGIILHAGVEELHLVALTDAAVHYLEIGNDAAERVKHRVEYQSLQRSLCVTRRVRNALHHGIQDVLDALAGLTAGADDVLGVTTDEVDYLVFYFVGHGRRHVNLVDDGNNLQVIVYSQIEVRDGLCLYALCGIHHQQCAFAGSDRPRHLVREVNVSRSVNQVQDIFLTLVHILHLDGVALNRDAALALQVHVVQHLPFRHLNGLCIFQQTVGQRRLAVVNMCNDAEVSYMIHLSYNTKYRAKLQKVESNTKKFISFFAETE